MPSLARKLGLGRMAYQLYHRPAGALSACIRQGGPLEQWKTARGRAQMRMAAAGLPPLLPPPTGSPEVHLMTGRTLWYQTAFFLHTLARHQPIQPVIHDDGTLAASGRSELAALAPFARFVSMEEAEEQANRLLPESRHPWLRRRRAELILFRKLIDVHVGSRGWRLFCDSDMLVFRRPDALLDWLRAPGGALHMSDVERSYGYELELLAELAGRPVPDRVNTGILGLPGDLIDWDRMEHWCRVLIERAGTHYYQEQALVALALSGLPHAALPASDYVVLPPSDEAAACKAVLHHYVADSKSWYFRENWRKVLVA